MATKKIKRSIWLPASTWEMIEKYRDRDARQPVAGFIDLAVKYYCCSFEAEAHKEILTRELINAIRFTIKDSENHIAATLFKLAGEQATLNLLIADQLVGDLDKDAIRAYRNAAYDIVRKRHGVFNFEDAIDDAETVAEEGN